MSAPPGPLPTGTVTFLRSDIEGSTSLARELGAAWAATQGRHHAIVRDALAQHGGLEVRTEGDAFLVAFEDAPGALAAAARITAALAAEPWRPDAVVRVRIGLHTGSVQRSGDDYAGIALHRVARIADAAHGGQVLLSDAVRALGGDGIPPGCTVRDLGWYRLRGFDAPERLFQLDVPGSAVEHPPLRGVIADADHLPPEQTPFIGRRAELERLETLLDRTRLLTLTGPGGTGKTRLAVELGRRVTGRFPDGAWFIDLSIAVTPAQVLATIARELGMLDGPAGAAVDRLSAHLSDRRLLLILDNLEQVVEAAPEMGRLLRSAPAVTIIATSRIPLGLAAEQVVPIRPMGLGPSDPPEALDLFLDRVARARPDLVVDDHVRSVAMEICTAVDGLPLGIELAAARARSVPLPAIRDRLVARASLPGSAAPDLPARQRTLESTVEWSLGLLPRDLLDRFGRLGAFEGGFAVEQVEALESILAVDGQDVFDSLAILADHSLINPVDQVDEPRYEMLETIRTASVARLVSDRAGMAGSAIRDAHAAAYRDLAVAVAGDWGTRRQADGLARLARDHANLDSAVDRAVLTGQVEVARDLSASLWRYWLMRGGLVQGRSAAEAVLAMADGDRLDASLARALDAAGSLAYWMADHVAADAHYRRQLDVARTLGDPRAIGDAAFNLSHTRFMMGDPSGQQTVLNEAAAAYELAGDPRGTLRVEYGRSIVRAVGNPTEDDRREAERLLERAIALDDLPYVALTAAGVALLAMMESDVARALHHGILALRVNQRLGDRPSIALSFLPASIIAMGMERTLDAARLLGVFGSLCQLHGFRPPAGLETFMLAADPEETVRSALGDAAFEAATADGRAMSIDEAVALVEDLGRGAGVVVPAI